jgi:hypothetical protein
VLSSMANAPGVVYGVIRNLQRLLNVILSARQPALSSIMAAAPSEWRGVSGTVQGPVGESICLLGEVPVLGPRDRATAAH